VAEARNITRAADRLGRTQSAISVQIQKLEDVLSAKLFRREARHGSESRLTIT
jgi:DNA-binding transcriptional LysR family regulator